MDEQTHATAAREQNSYPDVKIDPERQIRVLTILPSDDRVAKISCEMTVLTVPTTDAPNAAPSPETDCEYYALSYAWGSTAESIPIDVNGGKGNITVTLNLWMALLQLRKQSLPPLWIDQICIDQSNTNERNHQVRLMEKVYTNASRVIVWLGDNVDEVLTFFKPPVVEWSPSLSRHLRGYGVATSDGAHAKRYWYDDCKDPANCLQEIAKLVSSSWWQRIWVGQWPHRFLGSISLTMEQIVQEVALAREHPIVMFGPHEKTWNWLLSLKTYEHQRALSEAAQSFRYRIHGADQLLIKDVTSLIKILRRTTSTEPRDKVYALLSVASPTLRDLIKPDYNKPIADVFAESTYAIIKSSDAFDLLIYSGGQTGLQRLPSWACDFAKSTIHRTQDDYDWQARFTLFQDQLKMVLSRRPLQTILDVRHETAAHALIVKGRLIDRIDDVSGSPLSDALRFFKAPHTPLNMGTLGNATLSSKDEMTYKSSPADSGLHDIRRQLLSFGRKLKPRSPEPTPERGARFSLWPSSWSPGLSSTNPDASKWDIAVTTAIPTKIDKWCSKVLQDFGPNSPFQRLYTQVQDPYNSTQALQDIHDILKQTRDPLETITAVFEDWRRRVSSRYDLGLPARESEPEDLDVWISYLKCEMLAFTKAGFLCLVPKTAEPFDQLFLPNGGFAPMLLKAIPDQSAWEFGGFVYMNGIMDQELEATGVADKLKEIEVKLI